MRDRLRSRTDDRGAWRADRDRGVPSARIAMPLTAAVRWAVIGPASRMPIGTPVAGSLRIATAWIAGIPIALFVGKPSTHLMPTRSSAGSAPSAPRRWAGMACAKELGRTGRDADLGRQLRGARRERAHRQVRRVGAVPPPAACSPRRRRRRGSAGAAGPAAGSTRPPVYRSGRPGRNGRTRGPGQPAQMRRPGHAGSMGFDRPAHGSPARTRMPIADVQRSLENLKLERDAITLYDAPRRPSRRTSGEPPRSGRSPATSDATPTSGRPGCASRERPCRRRSAPGCGSASSCCLPGLFGTRAVSDLVQALEGDEESVYSGQSSPEVDSIAADEREHAEIWKRLASGDDGVTPTNGASPAGAGASPSSLAAAEGTGGPGTGRRSRAGGRRAPVARRDRAARTLAPRRSVGHAPRRHLRCQRRPRQQPLPGHGRRRRVQRPAAHPARRHRRAPRGAFSMAAGEYISMQSQRELYERQIALERAELEAMPEEEEAELAAVYRSKGFTEEEAAQVAHRIFARPEGGAGHAGPRGAGARPRPAGIAVGRRRRLVRRVRDRRHRCRSCRTSSVAATSSSS